MSLSAISDIREEDNTADQSCCPAAKNVAVSKDAPLPPAPPNTYTVIGAETTIATNVTIKPEMTTFQTFVNILYLARYPTTNPIAIEVKTYGKNVGLKIALIKFVTIPAHIATQGPAITAIRIVPIVSKKIGNFNRLVIWKPTILIATPTGINNNEIKLKSARIPLFITNFPLIICSFVLLDKTYLQNPPFSHLTRP